MQSRMKNPVLVVPGALDGLLSLAKLLRTGEVPARTLELMNLRASQINGCTVCVDMHARDLRTMGETDPRLFAVAAWRDSLEFSDAERAALALTEAATRISDRADPVPDDVWACVQEHYDESAIAILLLNIAMINFWNRTNVPTRQVPPRVAAAA